jgi:hypothetical protein
MPAYQYQNLQMLSLVLERQLTDLVVGLIKMLN